MTELLNAIEWEKPIFPTFEDPDWEKKVKQARGAVADVYKRVAPNQWLREGLLGHETYQPTRISHRFADMIELVSSQENACRYCYGAVRGQMKILGHSEKYISKLERVVQLAELNEKDRQLVAFCRALARSKPRPTSQERKLLMDQGFSQEAIAEATFIIAAVCLVNRVATFVASEPELAFEKHTHGLASYPARLMGPFIRSAREAKLRKAASRSQINPVSWKDHHFGAILEPIAHLSAAGILASMLDGCFSSPVLSTRTKALVFSVVARTLECEVCQSEMGRHLEQEGMDHKEIEQCIITLDMPDLEPYEAKILDWARNTVHYQPGPIQKRTRTLVQEIGKEKALEAIGVASLANTVVRLATLLT